MRIKARVNKRTGMNLTETAWSLELVALQRLEKIQWSQSDPLTLRLGDGAWYKPDFLVLEEAGELIAYDVKGRTKTDKGKDTSHYTEAARVRIKVVATRFPWIRFVEVRPGNPKTREPKWVLVRFEAHG
jgi:hypothetical protein